MILYKNYLQRSILLEVPLFLLVVFLVSVANLSGVLYGQVVEKWVARYNRYYNDRAVAIAADASGNVYVTGQSERVSSNPDYATVKYDSNGNQLWVARYESNGRDYPKDLAVDPFGNVYVTGRAGGSGNYDDFTTIKYDSNGNQLWIAYYGGGGNDGSNGIAVDSNGNVYVTGAAALGTYDCVTVKYDAAGNELWAKSYNGSANRDDGGTDIAIDEAGNVFVAGTAMNSLTIEDFLIISYDQDGNGRWQYTYNGPDSAKDETSAIAVKNGRVAVCGWSYGKESNNDYVTICFSTDGEVLWLRRYNGPGNAGDQARAVAIDVDGNVYVTGRSSGSGTFFDYATIKYAPDGTELWVARYNGAANSTDEANGIALDDAGNVYVTGRSKGTAAGYDYVTIKYDSNGNQLWVQTFNGAGDDYDEATAIFVDQSANIYVTGESWGGVSKGDFATVKYAQSTTGVSNSWSTDHKSALPGVVSINSIFQNHINIRLSKALSRSLCIRLFDMLGRQVYQETYSAFSTSFVVEGVQLERLPSGMYLLELSTGSERIAVKKVTKIH